ncbi:fluoride efflux transporter CrcB [Streptomyces sp. 8K308]|uniref:fluoride efflux transporter CrcB n=1 Tax=Streptomyces sp. 8K308 TaxID=2530388 RepID=UPI00104359A6|nr:fluoride efflux transporter CrcB [Streptomyces sp. 8K308]TDC20261.1 fluoride efflux transporter CrcB [Streptomyces sp. 8K308]
MDNATTPPRPLPAPSFWRGQRSVLTVVALGGGLGAAARYGAGLLWPTPADGFPWTTLLVNVVGCALIGVLMVLITEVWTAHRLVRPFLGTGLLGGFTTFSTYSQDIERQLTDGRALTAVSYLLLTLAGALAAVLGAAAATRRLARHA